MMAPTTDNAGYTGDPGAARSSLEALRAEIAKAVVGQDPAVTGLVVALLCRGHVLLEGVPGVAKTLLVRALASALELDTKRVQFTPDLMPSDITGSLVYDARTAEFSFQPGPVFTNLLLADEINRTPPKTQSSLLEAMEERQVTVDGTPRLLPEPFLVAATQNPVEYEGTYPLPEAQLDRFLLKLTIPLPSREDEIDVLTRHAEGFNPRDLRAAGCTPRGGPGRPGSRARRRRQDRGLSRDHRLCGGHLPRHPRIAVPHPRCLPARRDGPPRDGPRLGVADRPRLRHPGRCEGPGPPHAPPSHPAAPRGRDGGRDHRLGHQRDPRPRPRPPLMALTGRAALLAAIGTIPIGIWEPSWTGILAVNAPLALACACDAALAAPVQPARSDALRRHLGTPGRDRRRHSERHQPLGPPAARPPPRRLAPEQLGSGHRGGRFPSPSDGPARRTPPASTTRLRPTRRGDRHADRVTIRSYGPLGLFSRQGSHKVPWTVRVLPPFTSRKHLPSKLARLRELDGRTSVLTRGEGTEFDSLREYVPGDDTRSIDWRATARHSTVAVRTWRPERDRHILLVLDTGRTSAGRVGDAPRLDASLDAALLLAALASRAG